MHLTALRALGDERAGEPEAHRRGLRGAGHRRPGGVRARPRRPAARRRHPGLRHRQRRGRRAHRHHAPCAAWPTSSSPSTRWPAEMHSGMFGGAAPDALAALVRMLATLRDEQGNTTITGLDVDADLAGRRLSGRPVPRRRERARRRGPARHRLASPTCSGPGPPSPSWASTARRWSVRRRRSSRTPRARLNLRVPPGTDARRPRRTR